VVSAGEEFGALVENTLAARAETAQQALTNIVVNDRTIGALMAANRDELERLYGEEASE
jgi:hypothetical protein